jgi:hypothetical protein
MRSPFGRLAAHLLGSQAADRTAQPAAEHVAREARAQAWERWLAESSPQLLGEQRTQELLVFTFCAAFSLIGWLMIVQGADQLHAARQAAQWPNTRGTVESVEVYAVGSSQGAHWRPQVTYSYAVDGRLVTATRLSLGKARFFEDARRAHAYAARYPARSTVTVFYNPAEVTESVLEIETPRSVYANLAFGVALACTGPGLLVLFGFVRYRGRATAAAAT